MRHVIVRRPLAADVRYRELLECMPSGVAIYEAVEGGEDFIIREFSRAAERIEGVSRDQVIAKRVSEAFPGVKTFGLFSVFQRVWRTGVPERHPASFYQDERIAGWRENYVYRLPSGEVVAVYDDITERKRAEEALRQERDLLQALMDNIPDAIYFKDTALRFTRVNPAAAAGLGVANPDQAVGRTDADLLAEEQARDVRAEEQRLLVSGEPIVDKIESIRLADGESRWVSTTKVPLRAPDGAITGLAGITRDITARVRAEEEAQSLARFPTENPAPVLRVRADGTLLYANPASCGMLHECACAVGGPVPELWRQVVQAALKTGREQTAEARYGDRLYAFTAAPQPQSGYANLYGTDITERQRARAEHLRLTSAIEQAAEVIVITDTEATIQYVNPAFETITGYTRPEAIGQNPRILKSGEQDARFYRDLWDTLTSGQTWHGRFVNKKKDGSRYTEEATISPVRDADGTLVNYVAVKRDITHELQLQAQFLQAQKMEAVGQLAGGVAHDFNNLLTVIVGYSELVLRQVPDQPDVAADIEEIKKAGERASLLTRQLLAFSRKQLWVPQVLDLNQTVGGLEKMLRRVISEDIRFEIVAAPSLGRTKADPGQIEQLLMNLVVNARDAMPQGGTLTIATANVVLDSESARRHVGAVPGRYVSLTVKDTGCGMTPDVLAHVFEPFFTTKGPRKGTGLGLSTVYGLVQQSGGFVTVESTPGVGTTVTTYLPTVDDRVESTAAGPQSVQTLKGTETILLVEDEVGVRRLMRKVLERYSYTILEARDPSDAMAIEESYRGTIHLLLSDIIMPGQSGPDLAQRIVRRRPAIKVLFVSGYASREAIALGMRSQHASFLQKPFRPEVLAQKVRERLDGDVGQPGRTSTSV